VKDVLIKDAQDKKQRYELESREKGRCYLRRWDIFRGKKD
jgi:hypothetical protein